MATWVLRPCEACKAAAISYVSKVRRLPRHFVPRNDRANGLHGLEAHGTHGQDGRATKEALAHAVDA
jgi:hypothetical protein